MGDYRNEFVHFISVESRLARLQRRTIDSIDQLDFSLASRLDSTPSSNDRLDRSTRSISGSSKHTRCPAIHDIFYTMSQWFIRKTCPIVCYSQANLRGDQKCHGPAQYLFYVF